MEIQRIAIIDLDSVAFSIGNPNKILDEFGVPKRTEDNSKFIYKEKTLDELMESAKSTLEYIINNGGFTHYIGYIKGSDTIKTKRQINPQYKSNRSKNQPIWWNTVKDILINNYNATEVNNIEVDDAVNITRLKIPNSTICCIDSDLLSIEGTHYNWRKKEWITITKEQEEYKFWSNMIIGTHNNTKGLPGKGIKYAEKVLNNEVALANDIDYYQLILKEYINHFGEYKGVEEFYKNYKCLYILDEYEGLQVPEPIEFKL